MNSSAKKPSNTQAVAPKAKRAGKFVSVKTLKANAKAANCNGSCESGSCQS